MSHITTVKTQIRDLDALRDACRALHLDLVEGGSVRGYFENMARADYRILIPGTKYEVGVIRQHDGSYALAADFWDGSVERALGSGFGRLLQEYALKVIEKQARNRGKFVTATREKDGRIRVRIRG